MGGSLRSTVAEVEDVLEPLDDLAAAHVAHQDEEADAEPAGVGVPEEDRVGEAVAVEIGRVRVLLLQDHRAEERDVVRAVRDVGRVPGQIDDPPEVDQVEMHPYLRLDRLVGAAAESGARLMAYSPLGSGARPATLQRSGDPVLLEDPAVRTIAAELSATPAQVLIAWALARGTCAIPKSTNPGRIEENLGGATLELDAGSIALFPEDADGVPDTDSEGGVRTKTSLNLSNDWLRNSLPLSKGREFDRLVFTGRALALEDFNLQKQSLKLENHLLRLAGIGGTELTP